MAYEHVHLDQPAQASFYQQQKALRQLVSGMRYNVRPAHHALFAHPTFFNVFESSLREMLKNELSSLHFSLSRPQEGASDAIRTLLSQEAPRQVILCLYCGNEATMLITSDLRLKSPLVYSKNEVFDLGASSTLWEGQSKRKRFMDVLRQVKPTLPSFRSFSMELLEEKLCDHFDEDLIQGTIDPPFFFPLSLAPSPYSLHNHFLHIFAKKKKKTYIFFLTLKNIYNITKIYEKFFDT